MRGHRDVKMNLRKAGDLKAKFTEEIEKTD